ncbi:hypothetical protein LOTGIDRAFT_126319 [Lottia gigantea]|uniref:rRNA-processing protein EBP2 n=1 Tax=Lottia gigantea TaxID=225164 RepID=V4A0D1_LOTGI|nr:hypothetical protein LOTGIDRAFT_126319 [Lottia gigantea]ESO88345.1 hypothetical protein LOTGIDRAFT_126319 [Lottia gigantea]
MTLFKKFSGELSDPESSDSDSIDSDEELQKAFAEGKLKSGFVIEAAPKKQLIKNKIGLLQKLDEMKVNLDWIERLDMVNTPARVLPGIEEEDSQQDIHNDFKREMTFYRQAQSAVLEALPKLHKVGLKTKRPEDYFAEMAKSDDHMKRVREKLLEKQLGMERSEKAKKLRDLRKYGKQVQKEVLQKRQKEKRDMLEAVKKYRKGQLNFKTFLPYKFEKCSEMTPNKKRIYKNAKFGFGGQKKRSKSNTKESVNDVKQYGRNFSKIKKSSKKGGSMVSYTNNKRLGKSRRQNVKSKK